MIPSTYNGDDKVHKWNGEIYEIWMIMIIEGSIVDIDLIYD